MGRSIILIICLFGFLQQARADWRSDFETAMSGFEDRTEALDSIYHEVSEAYVEVHSAYQRAVADYEAIVETHGETGPESEEARATYEEATSTYEEAGRELFGDLRAATVEAAAEMARMNQIIYEGSQEEDFLEKLEIWPRRAMILGSVMAGAELLVLGFKISPLFHTLDLTSRLGRAYTLARNGWKPIFISSAVLIGGGYLASVWVGNSQDRLHRALYDSMQVNFDRFKTVCRAIGQVELYFSEPLEFDLEEFCGRLRSSEGFRTEVEVLYEQREREADAESS